ncbi:MAG: hypothetical protein IJ195_03855 [Lachnospiraceae bacterium]|nr:hypothetical protein [Lachnospiraceae bacterium]
MTNYINYKGAKVTIEKNYNSFVDFPNEDRYVSLIKEVFSDKTSFELSDRERYRVYMKRDELGKLFTGIEKIAELVDEKD